MVRRCRLQWGGGFCHGETLVEAGLRIIDDASALQLRQRGFGNPYGGLLQPVGIDGPIDLGLPSEMRHWVRLDTNAGEAQFLALHDGGASAAERIKHARLPAQFKLPHIFADEVRRIGKHEAIPVVRWPVAGFEPVEFRSI